MVKMKLSQKVQAMELSPIRKFVPYADAARAAVLDMKADINSAIKKPMY